MLSARGQQLLFADADGATTFEDISKLQKNLDDLVKGNKMEEQVFIIPFKLDGKIVGIFKF